MARRKEFRDGCSICGKKMYYGNSAYATTTGSIEEDVGGFDAADCEPWLTVACEKCGEKIGDAIADLIVEEYKKRREALIKKPPKCKKCKRPFSVTEALAGFTICEHCDFAKK